MTIYVRKSMMETYIRCPYMCRLQFVEGQEERSSSQFAALGTRFHEFANAFFAMASETHPDRWESLIPKSMNTEERKWARNFVRFERRRWQSLARVGRLDEWFPVARELHLTSEKLRIEGTIDRVDWYDRRQQLVVLVEYKCTLSMDYTSLRRQLHFYKLLYENADQPTIGRVVGIACINPRLDEVWFEYVNRRSEQNVLKWLNRIFQSIERDGWPKTKNPYVCMFCDYADICGGAWEDE